MGIVKYKTPQYVALDNELIVGISDDNGIAVYTDINLSNAFTDDFIPKYKLVDGIIVERTAAEIDADRASVPAPEPTEAEIMRADIDFLLMMMEG